MDTSLNARIEQLESTDAIRQLAAKYALALDMRDLDALVSLFPEDVRVKRDETGRVALKNWFDHTLRHQFTGTAHVTGNHIIEFLDTDRASGVVYSRNEHETGDEWVVMTMMYADDYERVDGRWLFRRRLPLYWYASDLNRPPIGELKMRWPGRDAYAGGWEDYWPSWQEFWERPPGSRYDVAEPVDVGSFLEHMRHGGDDISVRVR
jgi:hypothetical protein